MLFSFVVDFFFSFQFVQASNKFKRWNDYYESMSAKRIDPTKKPEIDVTRSATVRYFSVYPRKRDNKTSSGRGRTTPVIGAPSVPHSSNQQQQTVNGDQPNIQTERYTNRSHEFGPTLNQSSEAGQINYAWVD